MHEILTIQCGNTANYIGTHFWNFQDPTSDLQKDIDHDVLFSAGQARNGTPTYTPRLLIYDRPRNFGSMKRINALFHEPETDTRDAQLIHTEQRVEDHAYQSSLEDDGVGDAAALDDTNVRFWSDYNTQFYRPETYLPITSFSSDYPTTTTTTRAPQNGGVGRATYRARTRRNDVLDTDVRPFLEQCDGIALVSITSDLVNDAWAGYTTELVLDLASELPKTSKVLFSTTVPSSRTENGVAAEALLSLHDDIDAVVPFTQSPSWYSTASTALWMDTVTLPFRTLEHKLHFRDVTSVLTSGHKILAPSMCGNALGPIEDIADRQFNVIRGQTEISMESRLHGDRLVTTYAHTSSPTYPTSFPKDLEMDNIVASLQDSARGSSRYIADMRQMISGIKGASGYADRKDQIEQLTELEGLYKQDLLDSEESSDEDGF